MPDDDEKKARLEAIRTANAAKVARTPADRRPVISTADAAAGGAKSDAKSTGVRTDKIESASLLSTTPSTTGATSDEIRLRAVRRQAMTAGIRTFFQQKQILPFLVIAGIPILISLVFILKIYPRIGKPESIIPTWWGSIIILTIFIFLIGKQVTGRWGGPFLDEHNRYDLSRLQVVVWTIILLASLLTAMLWNYVNNIAQPLSINIPGELWALLGLNVATAAGTVLTAKSKGDSLVNLTEFNNNVARAKARGLKIWTDIIDPDLPRGSHAVLTDRGTDGNAIRVYPAGQLIEYDEPPPGEAIPLSTLFFGPEVGNFHLLDISKVQMFFFTLLVVLAYSAVTVAGFIGAASSAEPDHFKIITFLPLDQSLITLIAISHGGYIAYQVVPHSRDPTSQVISIIRP